METVDWDNNSFIGEKIMGSKMSAFVKMVISLSVVALFLSGAVAAQEVPRITKEALKGWLDNPDVIILDVRTSGTWQGVDFKIKGARREMPRKFSSWSGKYSRDKTLVLY